MQQRIERAESHQGSRAHSRLPHLVLVRLKTAQPARSHQLLESQAAQASRPRAIGRFYKSTPFLNELLAGYLMVGSWYVACLLTLTFKNWLFKNLGELFVPRSKNHRPQP